MVPRANCCRPPRYLQEKREARADERSVSPEPLVDFRGSGDIGFCSHSPAIRDHTPTDG